MNADKKFIIAITGFTKSGKTTAANYLKKAGFYVLDVDKFAHTLYSKNSFLYKKLIKYFGKNILKKNAAIDRKKLFLYAFKSHKIYKNFCSIIYPVLNKELWEKIKSLKHNVIILDMAVLFETGFYKKADFIVLVLVSKNKWLKRINTYPNNKQIKIVFKYQHIFKPLKKIALSNFIIYNNKSKKEFIKQTGKLSNKIKEILWMKSPRNRMIG